MSMLKKIVVSTLVITVVATSFSLAIDQAGNRSGEVAIERKFTKPAAGEAGESQRRSRMQKTQDAAKHGLLAQLLVLQTGLYRFLPTNPTDIECFEILRVNGIVPEKGWNPDKIVTRGDLSRVIVQALEQTDKVKDKGDPRAWLNVLSAMGIEITTIGEAVENVHLISRPKPNNDVFAFMYDNGDGISPGGLADALQQIFPPVRPNPVTPD